MQLSIGVSVLCLPWLRWTQPNLPRPIRVNLAWPVIYLIATIFVTVVPMIASPVETGYGLLMIFSSVPVYVVFIAWKNKPKWFQQSMGTLHKIAVHFQFQFFFYNITIITFAIFFFLIFLSLTNAQIQTTNK